MGKAPKATELIQGDVRLCSKSTAGWLCGLEQDTGPSGVGWSQSWDKVAGPPHLSPYVAGCETLQDPSVGCPSQERVRPVPQTLPHAEPGLAPIS